MAEETIQQRTEQQLVVFDLAAESYGVDINVVQSIIQMQEITRIPRTPEFVDGVINLRGKIIPVVDSRKRFGLEEGERNSDNRIVVASIGGQDIGMVVDAVSEVLRISMDAVEPPSTLITSADSDYIRGIAKVEDRLVILLDLEKVFTGQEKTALMEVALADGELATTGVQGS